MSLVLCPKWRWITVCGSPVDKIPPCHQDGSMGGFLTVIIKTLDSKAKNRRIFYKIYHTQYKTEHLV